MADEMREKTVIGKVSWRLIPYFAAAYVLCMVDRNNLGIAALTMNKDLGFTATLFGWGAGIFYVGYFFCEVPSNLALQKFGARRWIARIMISWGLVSGMMAFVSGSMSFLALRFLLGVAESGFFPGIVFYLTRWFPERRRAVVLSRFLFAQAFAIVVSSTLSGTILSKMNGVLGIAGWKWLFVVEAAPTIIMGVVTFFYLTEKPAEARWLEPAEREWLQTQMDEERARVEAVHKLTLWQALSHPRVLVLGFVYMGLVLCSSATVIFLPQIVKAQGNFSTVQIGFIVAIPYMAACVAMLITGYSSDRRRERKYHLVVSMLSMAVGLLGAALFHTNVVLTIVFISMVVAGYFSSLTLFWILPSAFLTGTASAGGIALINSIGNLGGFFSQASMGWLKDLTGEFRTGFVLLAVAVTLAAMVAFIIWSRIEAQRGLSTQGQAQPAKAGSR